MSKGRNAGMFTAGNPGRPKGSRNKEKPCSIALRSLYEQVVGSIKSGTFYVYAHYDANGDCFYVGKGSGHRAWEKGFGARNESWYNHVIGLNLEYEVRIIAADLDEDEALAIEAALIQHHKPKTNITYINISAMNYQADPPAVC